VLFSTTDRGLHTCGISNTFTIQQFFLGLVMTATQNLCVEELNAGWVYKTLQGLPTMAIYNHHKYNL